MSKRKNQGLDCDDKCPSHGTIGTGLVSVTLSGPMRGKPDWNYPQFHEIEQAWLDKHPFDIVLNPAKNFGGDTSMPVPVYLNASLKQVLKGSIVVLLPGWEDSEGSRIEVQVGRATGKVFYIAEYTPILGQVEGGWDFEWIAPSELDGYLEPSEPPTINAARRAAGLPPLVLFDDPDFDDPDDDLADMVRELEAGGFEVGPVPESERARLLDDAKAAISGDRNNSYGPPTQDFERTARMASAWGFQVGGEDLKSHHVAIFMELLKISRKRWSPEHRDSWLDTSGYSGCGWECVVEERKTDQQSQPDFPLDSQ